LIKWRNEVVSLKSLEFARMGEKQGFFQSQVLEIAEKIKKKNFSFEEFSAFFESISYLFFSCLLSTKRFVKIKC